MKMIFYPTIKCKYKSEPKIREFFSLHPTPPAPPSTPLTPCRIHSRPLTQRCMTNFHIVRALADQLRQQAKDAEDPGKNARIDIVRIASADQLISLADMAREVFKEQPVHLELNPPVVVCGDIHGQFTDLLRIFSRLGFPPATNYLFLGDYVDRGPMSLETISLLFCYKVAYPKNFFLLRGNHECEGTNRSKRDDGSGIRRQFQDECRRRYPHHWEYVYGRFNDAFTQLPLTALIGDRILLMHGGLSPKLEERRQLRHIPRGWHDPEEETLQDDLLWADPHSEPGFQGFAYNEPRNCSVFFGDDVVIEKCAQLDVDLIVRAHEPMQNGYEVHSSHHLITLFSAPNYNNQNSGAAMDVDQQLTCRFILFPAHQPRQAATTRGSNGNDGGGGSNVDDDDDQITAKEPSSPPLPLQEPQSSDRHCC